MNNIIAVIFTPNASRLAHLRKIYSLRNKYTFIGLCIGQSHFSEDSFFSNLRCFAWNESPTEIEKWLIGYKPSGMINLAESTVKLHAVLCDKFGLIGPPLSKIDVCRNKVKMREFLVSLQIPCPRFKMVDALGVDAPEELTFPLVVKPIQGYGSSFVNRVESNREYKIAVQQILNNASQHPALKIDPSIEDCPSMNHPIVAEEYLEGYVPYQTRMPYELGEISVESINLNGDVYILAIHDSPVSSAHNYYQKVMNSTPSRIPEKLQQEAKKYVTRIHTALGDSIPTLHTEFRITRQGLTILEFGARLGGASLYRSILYSTGNDMIEILIKAAIGEEITVNRMPKIPTITHYLFAERPGKIARWKGLPYVFCTPSLVDFQVYDDIGEVVSEGYATTRASGYIMLQGSEYDILEQQTLKCIKQIKVQTDQ